MLGQSYAVTLYTLWQLNQLDRFAQFERQAANYDLASLLTIAYHQPEKLDAATRAFRDRYRHVAPRDPAADAVAHEKEMRRIAALVAAVTPDEPATS